MSAVRDEIIELLGSLTEEELRQVGAFVKVLLRGPEKITEKEWQEVRQGEEEFQQGDWVRWEDIRRKDV